MPQFVGRCACPSHSTAYTCWADRYGMDGHDRQAIENDGGPCQCACHDTDYGEDECLT
jgi:hypothetical protein